MERLYWGPSGYVCMCVSKMEGEEDLSVGQRTWGKAASTESSDLESWENLTVLNCTAHLKIVKLYHYSFSMRER